MDTTSQLMTQQQVLDDFIEAAKDHLDTIEKGVLNLQNLIQEPEGLNQLFRAAWSLKGEAAILGFTRIQEVAYQLEDCFWVFKNTFSPLRVDQKLESLLLRVVDTLELLLDDIIYDEAVEDPMILDVGSVFQQLHEHWEWLITQALAPNPPTKSLCSSYSSGTIPKATDVVLGGQNSLHTAVVLGGLEGVKRRLRSDLETQRIAALKEALKYGKEGLSLVVQALKTETGLVQGVAYELLRERVTLMRKQALQRYIPLFSAVGVDYTRLRDLLAAGKWKEADEETASVMLKAAGKNNWDVVELRKKDIEHFPHTDLHTIDQLWVKYSFGHYSFSVQKRIWHTVGRDVLRFRKAVGWDWDRFRTSLQPQKYQCPDGHLPREPHRRLAGFGETLYGKQGLEHIIIPLLLRPDL